MISPCEKFVKRGYAPSFFIFRGIMYLYLRRFNSFFLFMDRKSKLIFWIFFVSLVFVLVALFSRFYILRDYTLKDEVECDPQSEVCFERLCLEECEPNAEPEHYKVRKVRASDILLCDPHLEECPVIDCSALLSCSEEYCTDENVPEGEECTQPEDFKIVEDGTEAGEQPLEEISAPEIDSIIEE